MPFNFAYPRMGPGFSPQTTYTQPEQRPSLPLPFNRQAGGGYDGSGLNYPGSPYYTGSNSPLNDPNNPLYQQRQGGVFGQMGPAGSTGGGGYRGGGINPRQMIPMASGPMPIQSPLVQQFGIRNNLPRPLQGNFPQQSYGFPAGGKQPSYGNTGQQPAPYQPWQGTSPTGNGYMSGGPQGAGGIGGFDAGQQTLDRFAQPGMSQPLQDAYRMQYLSQMQNGGEAGLGMLGRAGIGANTYQQGYGDRTAVSGANMTGAQQQLLQQDAQRRTRERLAAMGWGRRPGPYAPDGDGSYQVSMPPITQGP